MEDVKKANLENTQRYQMTMPMDRVLGNGVDQIDYTTLMRAVDEGEDWCDTCEALGDRAKTMADNALAAKNPLTARQFYLNATALYRVGQYTIVPDIERKVGLYRKLIDCYSVAAGLFDPPIEKVEIPFEGNTMSGWLRLPAVNAENAPVVVSVGGADGWREEHHNYSAYFTERGMAYLMIDGPGQGETRLFNHYYLPADMERAFSAVVDFAFEDKRVGTKVGIVGWSFGGYLVARTASYSKNLQACCVIGGSYQPTEILTGIPPFINVFKALTGLEGEALQQFLDQSTMEGRCGDIDCALLVVHGEPDFIFNVKGVQRIYDEAASVDKKIQIWPDGNHCVTNHWTEVTCLVADWFAKQLQA